MNRYISLLLTVILLATVSCQQDELVSGGTDETVTLTYSVGVDSDDAATRAIGDGQSIDQLLVGVFYEGNLVEIHTFENRTTEGKFLISIPLLRGKQYTLAFWAHDKDNTAYTIDQSTMQVTVDYSKYGTSLLASKAFEAFSAFRQVTVSQNVTDGGNLSLTRPFAQVNVAAAEEDILNKVKRTELKLTNLPTTFNPLTGAVSGSETRTFIFTDFGVEDGDKLTPSESTDSYTYLATVWALPATSSITVNLYDAEEGGNTIREQLDFADVVLKANHRVNIVGNMIQQQTMQPWNGVDFTDPTRADKELSCTVTLDNMTRADGQVLHIETSDELAYVLRYGVPTGYTSVHICNHLNMGSHDWKSLPKDGSLTPQNFPAGTLVSGIANDGTSVFTVSNITMNGNGATGLFGDTESLTVRDIAFDNIQIVNASAIDGVGLLAGKAKGNLTMQNVTVSNSSVCASAGKVGGLVGYISRKTYNDRSETLQADFTNCTLTSTSVSGSVAGKLVGELSGYDNGEVLNFTNCSATTVTGITSTDFCNARKSCFIETSLTEDHLLGRETYCRGKVNFDGNRFIPCWGGRTDIEPLDANNALDGVASGKVIYSPTDIAYYSGKSYSAKNVYLRSDIDMGGKCQVPQPFTPIVSMKYLDGLKKDITAYSSFEDCHTIYNLRAVYTHKNANGAAFIHVGGSDTHQNLVFDGAYIDSKHDANISDIDNSDYGNAYAGTLVSRVSGNYKATNIMIKNSTVSGVCKMGGLLGACWGNLQATNCNVDNCTIKNYDPKCINWYYQKESISSFIAYAKDSFYTDGECGGLIGFISGCSPTITNCSVTNTVMDCTGEEDKPVTIGVYSANGFDENNLGSPLASGKVTIAGRHVNQFIGDIRTTQTSNTITVVNPYVQGNSYLRDENNHGFSETETKTKTKEWTTGNWYNKKYYRIYTCVNDKKCSSLVGCAYVVAVTLDVSALNIYKHVGDYKGNIKITNSRISPTTSSSSETTTGEETEWNGALPETWSCTYNWTYKTTYNPSGESVFTRYVGDDFSL